LPDVAKDFEPCCSNEEQELLKKCIQTIKENTEYPDELVYFSVIKYYYATIVLEYYATDDRVGEYDCYRILQKKYRVGNKLVDEITTSDAPWASKVRQLVNFGKELMEQHAASTGSSVTASAGVGSMGGKKSKKGKKTKKTKKSKKSKKSKTKKSKKSKTKKSKTRK
jgi:hypothetical protein